MGHFGAPTTDRPSRARYVFLAYAAVLSLIFYLDRICIAAMGTAIEKEFGLDKLQLSFVFSAFTLGYLVFEVPSGLWVDRYGPRRVLLWIVVVWSAFTALTGCVWNFTLDSGRRFGLPGLGEVPLLLNGFLVLLLIRFLFGAGEAGAFPSLAKCTARWFPLRERGFAQGVITMAARGGGGLAPVVTVAVMVWANSWAWTRDTLGEGGGWRVTFWLFGLLGVVWAVVFGRWFRDDPADHPSVNPAELALLREGGASHGAAHGHGAGTPWGALLKSVNLWAYSAMTCCSTFVAYLYFTHFSGYLKERHRVPDEWLWAAGLPMIGGAIGCMIGGYLTDLLLRRTGSRRWSRRTMGLVGKGGGALLLLTASRMDAPFAAVVFFILSAFFADLALASQWAVCSDAGGRHLATVFGFANTLAGVGGLASPLVAGYVLEGMSPTSPETLEFDAAARAGAWDLVLLIFAGTLALSALCWLRVDAEEPMVRE